MSSDESQRPSRKRSRHGKDRFNEIIDRIGIQDLNEDTTATIPAVSVVDVYLHKQNIGDNEIVILVDTLIRYRRNAFTQINLDLSSNVIGIVGVQALCRLMSAANDDDNDIGNTIQCTKLIPEMILNLRDNAIGDLGAIALAETLQQYRVSINLVCLNLSENNIGCDGARALADALKVKKQPTTVGMELDLSMNDFDDNGACIIANALCSNVDLVSINFDSNKIGDCGIIALADSLKSNCSLQFLSLRYNCIGVPGAISLAKLLMQEGGHEIIETKTNVSVLKELDLRRNVMIGGEGASALVHGLRKNTKLERLSLTYLSPHSRTDTNDMFSDVIEYNDTLKSLHIEVAPRNDDGLSVTQAIVSSLKRFPRRKVYHWLVRNWLELE